MSKIAEKRVKELGYSKDPLNRVEYTANDVFAAAVECYDQAMQDFLEKAEKFFKSMYETMGKPNLGDKTIELFKNYMQNESEN